jgi:hypothetical protein
VSFDRPIIFPFEHDIEAIERDIDSYAENVIASLESSFLLMPKGNGFVEFGQFEAGYEVLKRNTNAFQKVSQDSLQSALNENPLTLIIIRAILGFTPPEWAYITSATTGCAISQGYARSIDRNVRLNPEKRLPRNERIAAMLEAACTLLQSGATTSVSTTIHRLDKADTRDGLASVQASSKMGIPYAMLLYERFLGRPFASHRDSISELVGDNMEGPIEDLLSKAGVSFRKTKRAERIEGFEQAPDFIIPSEFNPAIVIEAKITEDDGTARDKVTRIQHLSTLSSDRKRDGKAPFQVVACIDGRGFGIRKEDMKKIIRATRGKVFTLATLDRLIPFTNLSKFVSNT